ARCMRAVGDQTAPRPEEETSELGRIIYLGFDWNGGSGRLLQMFCGLELGECEQSFVFLRRSQELERDTTWADRTDHCGDFQRRFLRPRSDLQVKNIVDTHLCCALDDAATHREIQHRSFTPDFSSREGEIESDRNSQ